jgi:hypothetical protein
MTIDLNNALVSYLLTGNPVYSTSAGFIGPKYQVDHDISLLIPELWSRMFIHERDPRYLIDHGYLDKLDDFDFGGRKILQSRLGYRINERFVTNFFGRMFSDPATVFSPDMLAPELQNLEEYVDGIDNIVSTQQRIARAYFEDGTTELACPPLKTLLHIMAYGDYNGMVVADPDFRQMFTYEALMESDWYGQRLRTKASVDHQRWAQQIAYLERFVERNPDRDSRQREEILRRLQVARQYREKVHRPEYVEVLRGTLGVDPAARPRADQPGPAEPVAQAAEAYSTVD